VIYLAQVDPQQGQLVEARLIPMQTRRFRLQRATEEDTQWLCDLLDKLGAPFGTHVHREDDGSLTLHWR
jgi:poly-gamma-glutamate capsule biosynthesis protein CapA/YwtB (metallophosphatase superfamily)